jgi:all-trans-retinol 13,14-reductase
MQAALAQHYVGGAYFPKGGSSSIAKTLVASIIARGGQVFATSPVEAILTKKARFSQGFRATGVRVRGIDILVRKSVISDAGYTKTFGLVPNSSPLVNEQAGASQKKLNDFNMRPSPAFFMLCVGLDGTDTELNLPAQNVWHVKDWDHDAYMHDMASMEVAEFLKVDPPLIFISNGSAKDPDYVQRHPGTATITLVAWTNRKWFDIYANSDHQHRNEEYENLKRVVTDKMLQVLYRHFPKTQGRVKVAEMGSPLTAIKYLGRATGEIYNLDHGVERFKSLGAQLALHPQTTVKNLYLAGQDQLAVSVEGAMLSGVFACARANLFAFTLVCAPALFVFLSLSLIFRGCAIGQEQ